MPNRASSHHEAARQARWAIRELGRELRVARVTAGRTQLEVARAAGTSAAQLCRIENGRVLSLTVAAAYRLAVAAGLRLHLRAYPGGRRVLDQPQLELLGRLRSRIHAVWTWQLEAPVPVFGDLRAVDALLTIPGCRIAVEAITRLADFQAQLRAASQKARDIQADRLILLLYATPTNRRALAAAGPAVTSAFPTGTRAALRALAAGQDPGTDAIILL